MSFSEIAYLLGTAQDSLAAAKLVSGGTAARLRKDARLLLDQAGTLAQAQPELLHPVHGLGVIVGVTRDCQLLVTFGRDPFTEQYSIDEAKQWAL
ncbi:hypothetical protein ACQP2Y_21130 [Actinoplanes sp. CA-051413]|uniref:hypothetical protein n=1 Tax=Actinoplanes sp. CA-051413 TaxID=3239899 RepID=UPI003D96A83F